MSTMLIPFTAGKKFVALLEDEGWQLVSEIEATTAFDEYVFQQGANTIRMYAEEGDLQYQVTASAALIAKWTSLRIHQVPGFSGK